MTAEQRELALFDAETRATAARLKELGATWEELAAVSENGTRDRIGSGGRPEIGPYPNWTVQYLLSMDARVKAIVLGNGDLAGSWPIHVRSAKTGRILTLDELKLREEDLVEELTRNRIQLSIKRLDNPLQVRNTKRDLARVKTVIKEKLAEAGKSAGI